MKPNINSVEVHPQLSNNGHPVDGVLVCAGSLCLWFGSRACVFRCEVCPKKGVGRAHETLGELAASLVPR
jgi:hypothetical protein